MPADNTTNDAIEEVDNDDYEWVRVRLVQIKDEYHWLAVLSSFIVFILLPHYVSSIVPGNIWLTIFAGVVCPLVLYVCTFLYWIYKPVTLRLEVDEQ